MCISFLAVHKPRKPAAGWLSVQAVADDLEVSHMTVRRAIADGELVAYHIGNQWRIDPADYASWFDSCRNVPKVRESQKSDHPQLAA